MMSVLITGAGRENSIAAGVASRLDADGWTVLTSDLDSGDFPCDPSGPDAAETLMGRVSADYGPLTGLVLSLAHGPESGILATTSDSFYRHPAVNARASLVLISSVASQVDASGGAIVSF